MDENDRTAYVLTAMMALSFVMFVAGVIALAFWSFA